MCFNKCIKQLVFIFWYVLNFFGRMFCLQCARNKRLQLAMLWIFPSFQNYSYDVTPTGRQVRTFDGSSWKSKDDVLQETSHQQNAQKSSSNTQHKNDPPDDLTRNSEGRRSRAKRVKQYFQKCKNALGGSSSKSTEEAPQNNIDRDKSCGRTAWYVHNENLQHEITVTDNILTVVTIDNDPECLVNVVSDEYGNEDAVNIQTGTSLTELYQEEHVPLAEEVFEEDEAFEVTESSPDLTNEQVEVEEERVNEDYASSSVPPVIENKSDVATLVDALLGPLYVNFARVRTVLVRQARDLLVCEYLGNFARFEQEFCKPAAALLRTVSQQVHQMVNNDECNNPTVSQNEKAAIRKPQSACAPHGWPLSIGPSGIIVHLGPLAPALLRHGDCYVCVRGRSAPGLEVALVWRNHQTIGSRTLAEFQNPLSEDSLITCSGFESPVSLEMAAAQEEIDSVELPELLQTLLVSVERAIERVPLDELAFPCPNCKKFLPLSERSEELSENLAVCACQCFSKIESSNVTTNGAVQKKDSSIQTSPIFEFAGSIPHIDSDEDDESKVNLLKSCPGSVGKKPPELIVPTSISELPEKLLMCGINLPGTHDVDGRPVVLCDAACVARAGLSRYDVATLLLYYSTIPSSQDIEKGFTILVLAETSEEAALDILDKAMVVLSERLKFDRFIIWRPSTECKKTKGPKNLKSSKLPCYIITDEASLYEYVDKTQAPGSCGGACVHDQLEWVEFHKELEPFLRLCQGAGRALVAAMADIRADDSPPAQFTRRMLNHQHRQLQRALSHTDVQRSLREGSGMLRQLEERAQWLASSGDVASEVARSRCLLQEVRRVTRRLEQLAERRRARLSELARLRALEDETAEELQWLRKVGDEKIKVYNTSQESATDQESVKLQEQDFEKFYFIAMRHIDKGGDLLEEVNQCSDPRANNLKDIAQSLKLQLRAFSEGLEETRETLEDATRYFQLMERIETGNVADKNKEDYYGELINIANKLGNNKLLEKCESLNKFQNDENQSPDSKQCSQQNVEIVTSTPVQQPATKCPSQPRRRSVSSFAYIYKCNHHAAGFSCNCWDSDEGSMSQKLKNNYVQSLQGQKCVCGGIKEPLTRQNSLGLGGIKEVRESAEDLLDNEVDKNDSGVSGCGRCDSMSTEKSVNRNFVRKRMLRRTCSCQYFGDTCTLCSGAESSSGSGSNNGDNLENQGDGIIEGGSDGFPKSGSEELEDSEDQYQNKIIPPISVNTHLHCHASTIDIPNESIGPPMDPKTQKTLLLIMREMIQTERDYVKSLDYIIENYIPELQREDIPQALRGQRNVVFGNVEKIYEFHSQHFLRELEQCAENPLHVGQSFLRHEKKFYLYALYNKNKPKSDSLMSEYGTIFFKTKQIELDDKMDLASYLLKPVQRMGKYALLLQQLMKACPPLPPGAPERDVTIMEELKSAELMVKFQLRHGNDLLAMDSIRDCDVNLKEQGRLLRQNEFLVWEGRGGKKTLRQVFLFEELILFSKARRFPDRKNLDLYIYKNSIKMTDIGMTARIGDSTTKFEIWFRKRKPNDTFTLQSMSEDIKKAWTEEISQLLWKQAMKNREVRLQEMSSMGIGNKPCLDIRPSVDQISDRSISIAQLNKTAPKFRNSIAGPILEVCRSAKRPHSIISVSSVSSGSSSSAGSGVTVEKHGSVNDQSTSPKPHHRSTTLNSQCSMESGIIADISINSDDCTDTLSSHWHLQKSNSQHSNSSSKSNITLSSPQTEEPQVTLFHVPDELSVNL